MAPNKPKADDEDIALQDAIKASLRDSTSNPPIKLEDDAASSSAIEMQALPKRINIDDRIKDIALRAALELPLVHEAGGDTWVFIDPPPMQPEQDQLDYAGYIKRYEEPILVKKTTLTENSLFFEKAFEPTAQFRVVRRRKLLKVLRESNVKYVIDLTPPGEDEEAVYLMTELCCSEGVRLWYQAGEIWRVASNLIGGGEEYTSVKGQKPSSSVTAQSPPPASPTSSSKSTSTCMALEYSPVRHRSAIERVLGALMGYDPKLDSAPKVWTTFAVAKYFNIKHSRLDDYIISWLRAYPNSYFLEVLPEVTLQIADGLENYELARDTFAILVGEEALDNLRRARKVNIKNKLSTYGRKKENLPEHIHTRVEYASKSFLERITNEFVAFAGEDMLWIDDLPEYQKLAGHSQLGLQEGIKYLKCLLKGYVRGAVYRLLCIKYDSVPAQDLHQPGGTDLLPRVSRSDVWTNDLAINERILSRTFWEALNSFKLFEGRTNLDIKNGWNHLWDTSKLSTLEEHGLSHGIYREIHISELTKLVRAGELWFKDHGLLPSFDLPLRSHPEAHISATETTARPADSIRFREDFVGAQITQPDLNIPTPPIKIQQPSRVAQAIFDQDSTSTPDNRPILQDHEAQWPFGAPRGGSALDVLRNMNGSRASTGFMQNDPFISELSYESGSNSQAQAGHTNWLNEQFNDVSRVRLNEHHGTPRPEVIGHSTLSTLNHRSGSEFPAPQGFSSWTNEQAEEDNGMEQSGDDGRSTPPFFTNDDALPNASFFTQTSRPPRVSQEEKVRTYASKSSANQFFDLKEFFSQASGYIGALAKHMLHHADQYERPEPYEIGITNTLVCLQDSEWKYLPLWAGGNDDGSGGVFNDQVPMADFGFSTAGPDVHDGTTPASSSVASSEYEVISAHSDATSTFNNSMANNRGFSDHMHRGRVYAADSFDAASSHQDDDDSFTIVTDDDEEGHARRQMEVQERIEMAEEAAAKEARRIEKGKGRMEDESYADLFNSDDGDDEVDQGDDTDRAEDGDFDDIDMGDSDDGFEDLVLV